MGNRDGHHGIYFIFGLLFGGLIALLFAPKTGKETREMILDNVNHAPDTIDKTKESAEEIIHKTKEQIENLIDNVSHSIEEKIHKTKKKPEVK